MGLHGFMWDRCILVSVDELTTVVQMDARGRIVVPKAMRKHLGVEGDSATVKVTVHEVNDE